MTESFINQPRVRRKREVSRIVVQKTTYARTRTHSLFIWITLIGIFIPPAIFPIGGFNFTPGRFVVILLLVPALGTLLRSGRKVVSSDFFAVALAAWLIASPILNGGFRPAVGAEAVEMFGAYLAGRAFFFGSSNLQTFVRAIERIAVVLIALAIVDILSGRYVMLNALGVSNFPQMRFGLLRASSVFEGAEHYGVFCVVAAAIFLYAERGIRWILFVGLAYFGAILSLSSGPLMGLGIVTAAFSYDCILKQYAWRWKALVTAIAVFLSLIFLIANHPIIWLIGHLTFDPQTAWFRLGTWMYALPRIGESPFIGHGFVEGAARAEVLVFLRSIDCLWLVEALRYGLPAVVLLILTMFSSFLSSRMSVLDLKTYNLGTGLTLAIVTMGLVGISVHFWDAPWLLLNLLIGIRASIAEYEGRQRRRFAKRSALQHDAGVHPV